MMCGRRWVNLLVVLSAITWCNQARSQISIPLRNLTFDNLQEAVDVANPGDSIVLSEGTYTYDCDVWVMKDSLIIQGVGKVELLCTSKEHNVMWISGERIIVRNIHARHSLPEEYAHCTGNVFGVDVCRNCIIENCDINGCGRIGVYIFASRGLVLRNNKIHNNSLCAVDADGILLNKASDEHTETVRFEKNRIWDNGPGMKERREVRKLQRDMRRYGKQKKSYIRKIGDE
jgi:parallel beta-helix repeat protein